MKMRRSTRSPGRPARLAGIGLVLIVGLAKSLLAAAEPARRIVAIGDVHGSPEAFSSVLRAAELADGEGRWIGGNAILVQTGDLTDRGSGVREVLDLVRGLEQSAAGQGGRVLSLLGNHEVFNLIGYYDYRSTPIPVFAEIASAFATEDSEKARKEAYKKWSRWARKYPNCAITRDAVGAEARRMTRKDWMERTPVGFVEYQEAMSPRGEYGAWLRERPIVVNVEGTIFLHGGLSPELLDMELTSLDSINERAREDLAQFDRDAALLEERGVTPPYATLSELHCSVAYELQALAEDKTAAERFQELEALRKRLPSEAGWLLLDGRGPVWFRGYASWSAEEAEAGLETVFETFGGKRIVVGHTPQLGAVMPRFDARVFLIDTAMAYPELNGRAVALEIRGEEITAITDAGRVVLVAPPPVELPAASAEATSQGTNGHGAGAESSGTNGHGVVPESSGTNGHGAGPVPSGTNGQDVKTPDPAEVEETSSKNGRWLAPDGGLLPFKNDAEVLEFLETAEVVSKKTLPKGITHAKRLELEKDGIRARAVFHDIHKERKRHRANDMVLMNFRDSYLNNLAAYELGLMLGVPNLVPTTLRRVGRATGSIQLWIEKSIDEAKRRERDTGEVMSVRLRRRIADMWVFDNLINNVDRNQGNMLHDSRGEFWMIDHTRSFSTSSHLPTPEKIRRCSRDLITAIRNLDEEEVRERLEPYLRGFEIKALFKRRERLLEHLDEQIAARGEEGFLFSYEDPDDLTVYYFENDVPESPKS